MSKEKVKNAKLIAHEFFDDKVKALAQTSKILSHPTRVVLIQSLLQKSNQTVHELVEQMPFSGSTVSQHLYRLRSIGMVEAVHSGTSMIYSLNSEKLKNFKSAIDLMLVAKKEDRQLSLF